MDNNGDYQQYDTQAHGEEVMVKNMIQDMVDMIKIKLVDMIIQMIKDGIILIINHNHMVEEVVLEIIEEEENQVVEDLEDFNGYQYPYQRDKIHHNQSEAMYHQINKNI